MPEVGLPAWSCAYVVIAGIVGILMVIRAWHIVFTVETRQRAQHPAAPVERRTQSRRKQDKQAPGRSGHPQWVAANYLGSGALGPWLSTAALPPHTARRGARGLGAGPHAVR